jgi:molecular chaperone DnaK
MGEDKRREQRVEAKLAVRLAFGTLDEFVERYALNVSRGGIFVRSRDPHPVGTPVTFDVQLATGDKVVRGRGVVVRTTGPSAPGEARSEPGMGIRFTELDDESRALVELVVSTQPGAGQGSEPPGPPGVDAEPGVDPVALEPPGPAGVDPVALEPPGPEAKPAPGPAEQAGSRVARRAPPRVVGIDLGTTNSCVAVADGEGARVLASREGWSTIPSVVAFDSHGRLLVGHPARAQMVVNPRNTVYGSKRLVGRPFQSPTVQACRDRFHYEIVEGRHGEAAVRFAGREFSLVQISAFILAEVRRVASEALSEEVSRAVVTVPSYYNDHQRQAVREAGDLAGLRIDRIVNEPTAAALAYGYGRGLKQRVLVYDLGGGTFDASVVDIEGEVYEVLSTGGDTFLGGMDFDSQLIDHVVYRFLGEHGFAPPSDRSVWQRIRDAAEEAKVALSSLPVAVVHVPYLCQDPSGRDVDLHVEVTREDLEALTARLVERTVEVCRETLAAKGLARQDLEEVLLVGGQSRMPLVWRRIREEIRREPTPGVNPDEAVAVGAALLADSQNRIDSVVLIDVLPMGIGVGLPGGRMVTVIARNTRLPVRKTYELSTVRDGQTELELAVFQGDSPRLSECEYLGTLRVAGLPPAPRGGVKVAVEFALGAEGILAVTARDLATGRVTEALFGTRESPQRLREKLQIPEPQAPPRGARPLARPGVRVEPPAETRQRTILGRFFGGR